MGQGEWRLEIGAFPADKERWMFRVWAPFAHEVEVALSDGKHESLSKMEREAHGYFSKAVSAREGMSYAYVLDGKKRRYDPASRFQAKGIDGDSQLVDPNACRWSDGSWKGIALSDLIIYELHVGTYTKDGTFESIIPFLDYLVNDLGITAIELMPVAQFPGSRNWGYDGVLMYAVQNSYGGPAGLKKLVDACHASNLAVILDVVYNHVGFEGNYLSDFGPYFSPKYKTPWGPAVNYDDGGSDEVRKYVVNNALYWINEYHVDGLRLDAVHGIFDFSPKHILQELHEMKNQGALGRPVHLIAESDLNDPKIVSPQDRCGYGLEAQWLDDFHHSVHAYLTKERYGYYSDYGDIRDIEKSLRDGFVYDGKYSQFRNKTHGASSSDLPGSKFVVCIQNHDQVGNRPDGARLSSLLEPPALKVAAGLLLLSPYIPMLFMGEEFAEKAPFYFFTSHIDEGAARATREGRKKDFEAHHFDLDFIDPQDEKTFELSKIDLKSRNLPPHREIFEYYKSLIRLRKSHPALRDLSKKNTELVLLNEKKVLIARRRSSGVEELVTFFVLGNEPVELEKILGGSEWMRIFGSEPDLPRIERRAPDSISLPPMSVTVYSRKI
jgi:maltooligosyltrehalose trehalohydrolase